LDIRFFVSKSFSSTTPQFIKDQLKIRQKEV
jgi:hypothetical protein